MGKSPQFRFRLFVAGQSANSTQAIANLSRLCQEHLEDRHEIEIVDVLKEPAKGLDAKILLTPTLLKLAPAPARKIVGNLSNTPTVLASLGIPWPKL
jgi:circadian clock protein KaiB